MAFDWTPHKGPQETFLRASEYEVLYGGAVGGGKSDALIMGALRWIHIPSYHGVILRRTNPQLLELLDRCQEWYPTLGAVWEASKGRFKFPSGARIKLGHMQHEKDKRDYHGHEYQFFGWDELTTFSPTQYSYIFSRLRSKNPDVPIQIRATTNPGGPGHLWVKQRFIDATSNGKNIIVDPITEQGRRFIPATVYDNHTLMESDPEYVKRLEGLPEVDRLRFLYGDWSVFAGQVFSDLSQLVHGENPFEVPPEWEFFGSFDWGYSKPWCYLIFAVDFDGVLYLIKEVYGSKDGNQQEGVRMTNTEICREINKVEADLGRKINYRVADPACWSPTKLKGSNTAHGPSFVEDARNETLFFMKADNDRLRGLQQCHQRFSMQEELDEKGNVLKSYPRFLAFKDCENWWNEMMALYYSERNPEDVDTDQVDHAYDCTRYAFMSRPITPKPFNPKPGPGTFQYERQRMMRAKEYSKRHGVSLAAAYTNLR